MATVAQKALKRAGDYNRVATIVPLPVTATANTDYAFSIPSGARDVIFRVKTTTAYGAATDAQISIGSAAGGAQYVALVSIKATGQVIPTLATTGIADLDLVPQATGNVFPVFARVVQTGTASAVGAAALYCDYSLPVS